MKSKWTRLLLIVALAALIPVVWTLRRSDRQLQPIGQMASGTQLVLERVTYGSTHSLPEYSDLKYGLARFLPESLRKKFNTISFSGSSNKTLGIWIRRIKPPMAPNNIVRIVASSGGDVVGDERNFRAARQTKFGEIQGYELIAFPRRSKTIRLSFQEMLGGNWKEIGAVDIENPVFGRPLPTWKTESLPAVRSTNGLAFQLLNIGVVPGKSAPGAPPASTLIQVATPIDWNVADTIEIIGETGNRLRSWQTHKANTRLSDSNVWTIIEEGSLGREERALRIKVTVYKILNGVRSGHDLIWIVRPQIKSD